MQGTKTATIPTTRTCVSALSVTTPMSRTANNTAKGSIVAQVPTGALRTGLTVSRGLKIVSSDQPIPASRNDVTKPGTNALLQLVSGMTLTVIASAKDSGDHGKAETKAR